MGGSEFYALWVDNTSGFKFGRKLSFNTFVRVAPVFLMLLPYY